MCSCQVSALSLKEGTVKDTVAGWAGGKKAGAQAGLWTPGVDLLDSNNMVPEGRWARTGAPRMR